MSWNYRVCETPDGIVSIREVYYEVKEMHNDDKIRAYSAKPVTLYHVDRDELEVDVALIMAAFDKPTVMLEENDE